MDEMKVNTWILRTIISKIIKRVLCKKFDLDIELQITELELTNEENGLMTIKTSLNATGNSKEILNLIVNHEKGE